MRWLLTIGAIVVLLIGGLVAIGVYAWRSSPNAKAPTTAPLATAAAAPPSQSHSQPQLKSRPQIQAYSDLVRSLPGFADAEIGENHVPLEQAARIELPYHAYICPRQDLWIAHPDAPPLAQVGEEGSRGVHITREQVVFVHWTRTGRQLRPIHVIRDEQGAYRIFNRAFPSSTPRLPRFDYQWDRAMSMEDLIVVPCDQGVATIQPTREPKNDYRPLTAQENGNIQIALTPSGFIAWAPALLPESADRTVACYSGGSWREDLPKADWEGPFVHLIPYSDGSVLQIRPAGPARVKLTIAPLDVRPAEAHKVQELVRQLGDDDAATRDLAHAELAALGPAAWSILETLLPSAQGEVQLRLQEIIRSRVQPTLGRFRIVEDHLQPIWRLRDGVVFLAENGVQAGSDPPVTPAWISVRRGRPINLLPPALTRVLAIGAGDVYAARGEWVVSEPTEGAKLFFGQDFLPLNKEKDLIYRKLAGIDRMNRILLAPADAVKHPTHYLLIDPGIPDPTPMIQIWEMPVPSGEVGWDSGNWPAVKRQQAYTLREDHWEPLKADPITALPPATEPASGSPEMLWKLAAARDLEVWLGSGILELREKDRAALRQPMPKDMPADVLAGAISGERLFVMHLGGRISQLSLRPRAQQPFSLQAVFTREVPDVSKVIRMWVDPAGRACVATDDGRLIILFTERKIPPAILDMIPAGELKQARLAQ